MKSPRRKKCFVYTRSVTQPGDVNINSLRISCQCNLKILLRRFFCVSKNPDRPVCCRDWLPQENFTSAFFSPGPRGSSTVLQVLEIAPLQMIGSPSACRQCLHKSVSGSRASKLRSTGICSQSSRNLWMHGVKIAKLQHVYPCKWWLDRQRHLDLGRLGRFDEYQCLAISIIRLSAGF